MIVYESKKTRRLVGRLERGDVLPDAFERLAADQGVASGWVRALGAFERLELCEYDQAAQRYRPALRFDAPCEVLSLAGNVSSKDGEPFVHLHATVSHEDRGRVEVVGGHLVTAEVFACEFSLECFDDVVLERARDEATGLSLWVDCPQSGADEDDEPEDDDEDGRDGPSGSVTWAQVAAVSSGDDRAPARAPLPARKRMTEQEYFERLHPERGDYIDHLQFGICRVDGDDPRGGIRIRLPSGVRKVIKLDFLEVLPPRQDADRRVFPVRPRGRR